MKNREAAGSSQVARFFDRDPAGYAEAYSRPNTASAFFFPRRQALVMSLLRSLDGGLILDVGCGPGIYAKPCVDQGFRYYGLDVSSQMINEARKRFGSLANVEFAVGDARELPFPSNSIDGLLCLGMLEYVCAEQEAAHLSEVARVLKPSGLIVFSFLNASSPYWLWADHCLPIVTFLLKNGKAVLKRSNRIPFRDCFEDAPPTRKFRFRERTRLLQAAGLSVTGKMYFSLNILPAPLDARFPRQLVWVSSRLEPLLRIPILEWLAMGFLITAQQARAPEDGQGGA